jgi:hypothetical protein
MQAARPEDIFGNPDKSVYAPLHRWFFFHPQEACLFWYF